MNPHPLKIKDYTIYSEERLSLHKAEYTTLRKVEGGLNESPSPENQRLLKLRFWLKYDN